MTIYISSDNRWAALYFKGILQACGHVVVSKWHDLDAGLFPDTRREVEEAKVIVCIKSHSDRLIDIGGCFVSESQRVICVGDPGLFPEGCKRVDCPDEVVKELIE